jgi:hypothetical protein
VAELCTSSNGSLPPNFCSALHLNPIGAQHELLPASSTSARAPARKKIFCLIWPKLLCQQFLQPLPDAPARRFSVASNPANGGSCPQQRVIKPSGSDQIYSNPIDITQPGRLPSSRCIRSALSEIMQLRTVA